MDAQAQEDTDNLPATLAKPSILPFHSNPDILDEVCEYLAYDQDSAPDEVSTSKRNLLRLALTCKAFIEPALDRLWRSLDCLFPLLKILPAFSQSDGTYVLRGAISAEDWMRFDSYARRIRKFVYTRDPDNLDIAMHVYFRLAQLRSTALLPSLRHLHCPAVSQNDFLVSGICLFLSPSLQTLEFESISSVEDKLCGTVLHTLYSDGARMEKVTLRGHGLSWDTLSMAIKFEHLRELELAGMGKSLDLKLLQQIGALPWLVDLAVDFTDSTIPPLEEDIGLRDLKSLMITGPIPFIESFLPRIATPYLETFVAVAPSNPPVDKKAFLESVVSRWKDTLSRIGLVRQQTDDAVESLTVAVLAPLLPLRRLTYLRVEGYSMDLTDLHILEFANAWPLMTTLLLPFIAAGRPRPTIHSLRTVASLLPHLRHLRIPLDTADVVSFLSTGSPHTPLHELHTLTIASADDPAELRDLLHFARHVDYFFPRLRWLNPFEGHDAERWQHVHEMIQMYQGVRKEAAAFEREKQKVLGSIP
ncbi:hypothetical protein M413DRAFT_292532 [Hebeloma cylindrosporum]|uniref:F-box domain-containing protein n=1 Tax=Hebeloma cylindrosporum TaxID=76867 RepID=A0A0C3BWC1_HEBCY|nr:hypothetical protein M413DRAFT_292532 [Hebeloma cylindrosporum h7]